MHWLDRLKHPFSSGVPALDSPPTSAEEMWWRTALIPLRRRITLTFASWMGALAVATPLFRDPSAFAHGGWMRAVFAALVVGGGGGWLNWRIQSPELKRRYVAGKRLRDALLASPPTQGTGRTDLSS